MINYNHRKLSYFEFSRWLEASRYHDAVRNEYYKEEEVDSTIENYFEERRIQKKVLFEE